ncbi:MAG: hypothetical protein V2A79_01935 [Planctomycetota bacterium]
MAANVYNVSKNNIDTTDLRVLLLVGYTFDADHATVAAVIAAATGECTFTNYARKALADEAFTVINATDRGMLDATDPAVWASAGGAVNNLVSHAVVYDHNTNDADSIPVSCHTVGLNTNGGELDINLHADGILYTS